MIVRSPTALRAAVLLLLGFAAATVHGLINGGHHQHQQQHQHQAPHNDADCALILAGGGRSSAFDYNVNMFRGAFHHQQPHMMMDRTCITYGAINNAYVDARKRINVASPHGEWKTEDIATVGELLLDMSIQLARTYGLSYEEIEKGLPQIDTSGTLLSDVCPPILSGVHCELGKYRRFDGLCNNPEHPTWGAAMAPFQRLIGPLYADGINAPRVSVTGRDLPLSRVVSRTIHPDEGFHDHAGTVMVIAWGQFMDHDFTLTGTPLDPVHRNDPEECCKRPQHLKHPYCNEIRIPDDDYFYKLFNVKCLDFVRGFPSPRAGCRLGSRTQFNTLTGVIDGNTIYGVKEGFSRKLRAGHGGKLRMNPVFAEYGLKDLLPLKLDIPDEGCTRPNKDMFCFEAGEIRVNEQLVLTCMHTMLAREHNRLATGLAELNPHWDDETTFQEARRINIAIIQHITYNEFLPILLGKEVMQKFGLVLLKDGYWDGYDNKINPGIIESFASAAFRFGHSLLPTAVERWSKAHKFIASKRLSDLIRRPYDLYRAGVFDEYLMGLMNQVAQAMDDSITQEVTNHLFKKEGHRFGMDLVSLNMQRGREFGVPGYMEFRKFCGLPVSQTWDQMEGTMPNDTIRRYASIFEHPADIDLWSGGVSEKSLPGSMLGPTFACIIATQLSYIRRGDRFWYELPHQPSTFTPEQLQELRKAKLARLICDNTDLIDTVQIYPMVLPDHELNRRVPCKSGIIPSIDLTKWKDNSVDVPHYSAHENDAAYVYNPSTVDNVRSRRSTNKDQDASEIRVYDHYVAPPQTNDDEDDNDKDNGDDNDPEDSPQTTTTTTRRPRKSTQRRNKTHFQVLKSHPSATAGDRPESGVHDALESADLANDEFFYKNLAKENPTSVGDPAGDDVELIEPANSSKNKDTTGDVELVQGKKKGAANAVDSHKRYEQKAKKAPAKSRPDDDDEVEDEGDEEEDEGEEEDEPEADKEADDGKPQQIHYTKQFDTKAALLKEVKQIVKENERLAKESDGDVYWEVEYEHPKY